MQKRSDKMTHRFTTLPLKQNFLAIDRQYSSFENSKIIILPCPYEKTTSYGKGTAKGPQAILKASHYVEFFDEETLKEVCFEQGIATLKPISFEKLNPQKSLHIIYEIVKQLIKAEKFTVTLGGEHSISSAVIKAFYDSYDNLSVLHFDAHSDLRNTYEGTKYSHACFAARVTEFTNNITQVGIRAQCKEEYELIRKKGIKTFYAYKMRKEGFDNNLIKKIVGTLKQNVYITFDVDYFDPSIMPSTGTPEPNGFYWNETMMLLKKVCEERNIVGFDVVELSPKQNLAFPDLLTAKLVYKILNYCY